ncbi:MAG: Do family serine endopeptidase [Verrucomicrobiota bacterium]|nr:Do family serine endopeptidase [Verrucomicrobiota bacterium]
MRKPLFFVSVLVLGTVGSFSLSAKVEKTNDAPAPALAVTPSTFELDAKPIDRSNTARISSYSDMLEKVRPAVVSVTTARIVKVMRNDRVNPMEDMLRRFYGMPPRQQPRGGQGGPDVEERKLPNGIGSGVIISADGYVLTNNHVISEEDSNTVADEIIIRLNDEREFPAKVIGRDPRTDVALVKVDATALPFLKMAESDNIRIGDIVFAIGNPMDVGQTVTMGIVSATGRTNLGILGAQGYENFIQTDASINPGNSGGALVDVEGRLVGINSAILSRTGGNIGIGFAVPTSIVAQVARNLVDTGSVQRGFLGVNIANLTTDLAEAFGLPSGFKGVIIEGIQKDEAADKSGLKRGDVILKYDNQAIDSVAQLRLKIAQSKPGQSIPVTITRDGKEQTITVTLGSQEGAIAGETSQNILDGVTLTVPTDELRKEYNLAENAEGLIVTAVEGRSRYASSLREGMVILEINDRTVKSIGDARDALRRGAVNKLWVAYRDAQAFIAVRVP